MFLQVTLRSTAAAAVVPSSTVVAVSTTMFTTNATKRLQQRNTTVAVRHRCFVSCTEDRRPFRLLSIPITSQRRRTTVHHPLTPNRSTTTTTIIPTNDRLIRQLRCTQHHRYLTTTTTTTTTSNTTTIKSNTFTTNTCTTTQPTPHSHSQQQSQQQSASTKKKQKKHPRKRKLFGSHHPSTTMMTTKDKIRLLMDTNQVLPLLPHQQHLGGLLVVAPAKDLLDLAQSRMSYVRNSLYQYWNPDYNNNSHSHNHAEVVHNTTTTWSSPGTATSPPSQVRTYKAGLVIMDTRWWVWNVLFALLPATVITIYCELRGKHLMYAYHHQLEVDQIRQVMGEDEFTIERANAIIAARNQDRDEKEASLLWNGDLDEMAWKWIQHVVWTVYKAGTDIVTQLWNEYYDSPQYNHNNNNNNNNNHETNDTNNAVDDERHGNTNHHPAVHDNSITNTPTTIPSSTVSSTPTKESTKPKTLIHSVSNHTPISGMTTTEIPPTTTNDDHDTAVHPSIETLLQRIQQMEERIQQQLQQQQPQQPVSQPSVPQNDIDAVNRDTVEQDDAEAIRVIAQRMQHMKQSNVQNRFEIDAKQKWNKYIVDVVQNDEANENTTQDHHHHQQQNSNDTIPTVSIHHRNSTSTSASTGNGKHDSIPTSSMSSTPTDAASSMTDNVKLLWSRYGTPIFKVVQQRIGWSDTNQDTNSSNLTINDRLSTNVVEHHATLPPPNNVVVNAVDDVSTTPTPNVVIARHDSNTVSSDSNTMEESTKIDPPPVPPLPWWKFF